MFGDDNILLAKNTEDVCEEESEISDFRFTGKVDLNRQTGDLTIKKITTSHIGKYKLKIIRNGKTSFKLFNVTVSGRQVEESVLKGSPVTLKCDTEIWKDDKIQWMFGAEQKLIAEMTGENRGNPEWFAKEFRDQMKLDPQTGSLIIEHTRPEHSGLYKIVINSSDYSASTLFTLIVFDEQKSVLVMKRADVTLRANTGEQTQDQKIFWMFADDNRFIDKNTNVVYEEESEYSDLKCTDNVDLNRQTGDLTIKKIKSFLTGKYKLKIIRNGKTSFKLFNVSISGHPVNESVLKGASFTLKCVTEIQKDDKIQWMFGAEQKLIAEMTGENLENPKCVAVEFRDQMKLNPQTGSLIIEHTRPEHSGLYKIVINSSDYSASTLFTLIVFDEQKSVPVMEEADVTLRAKTGEQTGDHKIFWMFGDDNILLAKNTEDECEESKNSDLTFKGDVDLNRQTGDLTSKKITIYQTGKYKLKIIGNGKTSFKFFRVTISGRPVNESVVKGSSVTLKCVTEIQRDEKIQWMFGAEQKLIAEMTGENLENPEWFADEFRAQMKLNPQTGSLIIEHTRPEHSGLYKIVINSSDYSASTLFTLIVFDEEKSVMKMEDVTLHANTGELTGDHEIFWMFGDDNILQAKNTKDVCEESKNSFIFRNRVYLNPQTGDLTIKKITNFHTGQYKLKIIRNGETSFKFFRVTISDSTEEQENDSVTVSMPLLDGANETTSSL